MGRLGRAIINYPGFYRENFRIVAAFDGDRAQVGNTIGEFNVQPMSELSDTVIDKHITIGIVAVPAQQAQNVIDELIRNGIKGILNYAPVAAKVPMNIVVRNIDPVLSPAIYDILFARTGVRSCPLELAGFGRPHVCGVEPMPVCAVLVAGVHEPF